jgi:hypothetical protein
MNRRWTQMNADGKEQSHPETYSWTPACEYSRDVDFGIHGLDPSRGTAQDDASASSICVHLRSSAVKSLLLFFSVSLCLCGAFSFAAEPEGSGFKKVRLTDVFYGEGANVGDFNHDGKMDVVSGPYWYEGPAFEKKQAFMEVKASDPHKYSENFFAFTQDVNGDGWTDILIIGFPGKEAFWYENHRGLAEAGGSMWIRHVVLDVVDNESPTFANIVGDEKAELICMSGGHAGYATPDSADAGKPWTFHAVTPKRDYQKFTHGLGVGDVNGDGRIDLLEHAGWWEQPAKLGGEAEWAFHPVDFGSGGAQMYAYDVDGDGVNDIVTSIEAHGYGLAWFKQTRKEGGESSFEKRVIVGNTAAENPQGVCFTQMHAVDLVDVDGDGLKDIVTGKRWWAHGPLGDPESNKPAVLYWFGLKRSDKGAEFIAHRIDDDSGVGTQVVAGDIHGDGKTDVVVGNKKGTFLFVQSGK